MQPTIDPCQFRRMYSGLRRFAAGVSPASVDPDEVVGNALLDVSSYRGAPVDLPPGDALRRRMIATQQLRRRALERSSGRSLHMVSASSGQALSALPPDDLDLLFPVDRAIIVLLNVEHWPIRQVAALVRRSPWTTVRRARWARRRLERGARLDPRGTPEAVAALLRETVTRGRPVGSDRLVQQVELRLAGEATAVVPIAADGRAYR